MPVILSPDSIDLSHYVRPGDTVIWGQANAEPEILTRALVEQRSSIGRFKVMLGISSSGMFNSEHGDYIDFMSYCGSGHNRNLLSAGLLDIVPCHYSDMAQYIFDGRISIDVVFLQLSPSDEYGRYSLSLASEYIIPAIKKARVVIAEINERAPWVAGEYYVTSKNLTALVHTSRDVREVAATKSKDEDILIADNVADLIDDGATLQIGIGSIPESILRNLKGRQNLGVHSGSLSDGVAELMKCGVINNSKKTIDKGVTIGGVLLGTKLLYDYVNKNPLFFMRSTEYTHNASILSSIDNLVAINSAVEVDLTGQINSEMVGDKYVGAVGGALDFIRGSHRSKNGVPIIALPSTAGDKSRIVASLNGPVTIPRSDAGIIVTENGIADLRGLSISKRIEKMLDISHPLHRVELERQLSKAIQA